MPTLADYESAFMKADAAGDTQAARALAAQVRTMRAAALKPPSEGANGAPVGGSPPPMPSSASSSALDPLSRAGMDAADAAEVAEMSPIGRFFKGSQAELAKQVVALKGLVGQTNDTDQAVVNAANRDTKAGGTAAMLGGIAPQIAESAIPAGTAIKGVQAATKALPAAARAAATIGTMVATNAAQDFVLNPGDVVGGDYGDVLKRRADSAGTAGIVGAGFGAAGQGAVKVGTGLFQASKTAAQLLAQGVTPTLEQGTDSLVGKGLGKLTSRLTNATENRQSVEVRDALVRQTSGIDPTGMSNAEALVAGKAALQGEQNALLGGDKRFKFTADDADNLTQIGTNLSSNAAKPIYQRVVQDIVQKADGKTMNVPFQDMKTHALDPLQAGIDRLKNSNAVGAPEAVQGLEQAKNYMWAKNVGGALNPDEFASAVDLHGRMSDFSRYESAIQSGAHPETGLDLPALARTYAKADPAAAAIGESTPLQSDLVNAAQTLTTSEPAMGRFFPRAMKEAAGLIAGKMASPIAVPVYGASLLSNTKQGARFLLGDYPVQQAFGRAVNPLLPYTANLPADVLDAQGN